MVSYLQQQRLYGEAMTTPKPDIKALSEDDLRDLMTKLGQPKFRVRQIWQWLYEKGAGSFDAMSNIPDRLRRDLSEEYSLCIPQIVDKQISSDGTRKYLLEFADGVCAETVGIPSDSDNRLTVCFSTQAGCAMGCVFCATGRNGFTRNLTAGEMYDQVMLVSHDFDKRVSNVVAMGQGEPFANYDECLRALRLLNSPTGLDIGARHITVSTCGLFQGIRKFSREPEQFTLAISLHSAIQDVRNALMPGVAKQPLSQLKEELQYYSSMTNRRVTLEYALIENINDRDEDISALASFCKGLLCHVNLIPLNPVKHSDSVSPDLVLTPSRRVPHIRSALENKGIGTTVRVSRGADIDGACGQLAQKAQHNI